MNPKVSIVIPSLNSIRYIEECLQSVLNQTLQEIEILCVDANSTDGTLEYLKELESKDKRLKVIVSDKKSYGYQMNLGIKAAKGEYLGIVESDDYIKPNMYEELYRIAKEKECDVVKGDILSFEDKEQREFSLNPTAYDKSFYHKIISYTKDGAKVLTKAWCMNQSGIYKFDFLREFNISFNESAGASYQDAGFWFQVFTLARSIYFVKKAHYCYRRDNPNSSSVSKAKVYCICDEFAFMRNFLKKHPKIELQTARINAYLRFRDYTWNLGRIAKEYKLPFLQRIQSEFLELESKGELDWKFFDEFQRAKLERILKSPQEYYQSIASKPKGAVERVKNQLSYKLGAEILKTKNPMRILRLPFVLYGTFVNHRFEQRVLKALILLKPELKPLRLQDFADYDESLKVKEHLSYRLGSAMLKNPFTFPFKIPSIYKNYKRKK